MSNHQILSEVPLPCQACLRHSDKMSNCSGCHQARYCSSECQKNHWNSHKASCRVNAATQARIDEDSTMFQTGSQGPQLDLKTLAADLKSWNHVKRPALTFAAAQALQLRTVPANASTHCLFVSLEYTPSAAEPSKRFKVADVEKMSIADMLTLADEKQMGDTCRAALKQSESNPTAQPGALFPHILLFSRPLLSLFPVGIEKAMVDRITDDAGWEATFKHIVLI